MTDNIIEISKAGLRSIFTVNKYDDEILDEDLSRILFIRNFIEESILSVKDTRKGINAEEYINELKKYALELFLTYCEESILFTVYSLLFTVSQLINIQHID